MADLSAFPITRQFPRCQPNRLQLFSLATPHGGKGAHLLEEISHPHGVHLADARAKLVGLANYAEAHGDSYVRIESIAKAADGTLRVLDLLTPAVREAIKDFDGASVSALYESTLARPYE